MNTAVVHEWIAAYAGSEQVFEAIAQIFPDADLYALSRDPSVSLEVGGRLITTTYLDHPGLRERRALTLPLMPLAWRGLRRKGRYDLVITSHHAFAHTNRLGWPSGLQLVYVHSPARYLWNPDIDGRGASWYLAPAKAALRHADLAATHRVASYAANSTTVARRVEEFWNREAVVIHPPVRVEYFGQPFGDAPTRDYILGVGRWIRYKNLHRVIEIANYLGLPVKIAGRGPDKARILAAAGNASVPTEIVESPSDEQLRDLYRNAAVLVFPTVEDFGIVPVEAQAAGTPVVAIGKGGALDTVVDRSSGVLTEDDSLQQLAEAIEIALLLEPENCIENANRFTREEFDRQLVRWINSIQDGSASRLAN